MRRIYFKGSRPLDPSHLANPPPHPLPLPEMVGFGERLRASVPQRTYATMGGGDGLVYMIQRLNETKIVVAVCAGALRGLAVDKL